MVLSREKLNQLQSAFRPHAPIEEAGFFCGRDIERERVQEALSNPGLQVVIYGERGCGKTSLANVSTEGYKRIKIFCEEDVCFHRLLKDVALELQNNDPERIVYDAREDTIKVEGITLPIGELTGNSLLSLLPRKEPFCIIFDELDRIQDRSVITALAELLKNVATNRSLITFIMVGVADTASALLDDHASNYRNIREVQLGRMEDPELKEILLCGEKLLGITFSDEVSDEILNLCDGMPYYLHLLAKNAAKAALEINAPTVEIDDLNRGSMEAASDADQELRTTYEFAIISQKGTHIYKRIIWAMANLSTKWNSLADITAETNKIALDENDKPVTPQGIGSALRRLASYEKGKIIYQPSLGVYSFTNPLMKGFIRLVRYSQ